MGDIADWYLESADPYSYDWQPRQKVACKHCGEKGLTWVEVKIGQWRLAKSSTVHVCKRAGSADDVADLV